MESTRFTSPEARFACDAMLGGLARWLRAAGYEAFWQEGIDDWDLVRLAQREERILLSSDTGIFRIGIVRDGEVAALMIPHGLSKSEQLALVLQTFQLPIRPPRCMSCGGTLVAVQKESVRDRTPAGTFKAIDDFYECARCGHLYWQGSHWPSIAAALEQAAGKS